MKLGSIQISDGTNSAIVDLSKADTIGDLINTINNAGIGIVDRSVTEDGYESIFQTNYLGHFLLTMLLLPLLKKSAP